MIELLFWIILVMIAGFFIFRYHLLPWKTSGADRTVKSFFIYLFLLLLIAPVSIAFNTYSEDGLSHEAEELPSEDDLEQWTYEGDFETLDEATRTDAFSLAFDAESLQFQPHVDGFADIHLFVEENDGLENEVEIFHVYPLISIEGQDMTHVFPEAEYNVQNGDLIFLAEERASVSLTSYTNDFAVNQFVRDRQPIVEPFNIEPEPMMIHLQVPPDTGVSGGQAAQNHDVRIHRSSAE
ncbi:hypothetical protein [Salisediminibacterium halotolerans]|uniref:hypothetical protein n=1 Tax=Salisediminibacterium halotolerans TaxID=517425 RepID=UPI000EB25A63|nr:hypothetical protein [Salisediminibacterium halotolerans]RLJ73212.1 hypothetical protein BCL39_1967 [Actinophytocola xinjiangensis]RPE86634.1 hypothetical protein EDD67_2090 [Salisediminibacterium halotolerans]TWG34009.1 hypothetical protein BCL52_1964 [Salisediminibacterium halotolerans]GEL09011.1 hypothetical protein SHA02_24270 [Salisediminibacterium halotolerans]